MTILARCLAAALVLLAATGCKKKPPPGGAAGPTLTDAAAPAPATTDSATTAPIEAAPTAAADATVASPGGHAAPTACEEVARATGAQALASLRRDGYLLGIDVAHYQGRVDWPAVAAAGVTLVYIKATDGTGWTDPCFERNWTGARAAGLRRGAYHFFHPGFDPLTQAQHFARVVGRLEPDDLPPAFDLEYTKDLDAVAVTTAIAHAETWLAHATTALGRRPIIYSSARVFREYLDDSRAFAGFRFWLADYKTADRAADRPALTPGETGWSLWQIDADVTVPGVANPADVSWFNGDLAALDALIAASVVQ